MAITKEMIEEGLRQSKVKGKYEYRKGRKIVAKIYFRPLFFENLSVNYDKTKDWSADFPHHGLNTQTKTLDELVKNINELLEETIF